MDSDTLSIPDIEQFHPLIHRFCTSALMAQEKPRTYEIDDLWQEAHIAYLKARQGFDADRGVKFITYFYRTLQTTMASCIRRSRKPYPTIVDNEILLLIAETGDTGEKRVNELLGDRVGRDAWLLVRTLCYPPELFKAHLLKMKNPPRGPKSLFRAAASWLGFSADKAAEIKDEITRAIAS